MRPTADRVREAIFDCAGVARCRTGGQRGRPGIRRLGCARPRGGLRRLGASAVTFVEKNAKVVATIKENLAATALREEPPRPRS